MINIHPKLRRAALRRCPRHEKSERGKESRSLVFIIVVDSQNVVAFKVSTLFGLELCTAFPTTYNSLHKIKESL